MGMDKQTAFQKILYFFLTKIIICIAVIIGLVVLTEGLGTLLLDKTQLNENAKRMIIAVLDSAIALSAYIFLFRAYEKRRIKELSTPTLVENAIIGCVIGFALQSLFVLIIFLAGTYSVVHVNPISTLIIPFAFSLAAGFVAEILLYGILFRLIEEQSGTVIALIFFILLFAVLHINSKRATFISVCATAVEAGFMLPAAYIFSRSLWLPIFLHFSWDFAEPGIFGGINPSTSITQGLFVNKITGISLITGGEAGPQNSLQALIVCLLTGPLFLVLAKQKNNFIKPIWQKLPME